MSKGKSDKETALAKKQEFAILKMGEGGESFRQLLVENVGGGRLNLFNDVQNLRLPGAGGSSWNIFDIEKGEIEQKEIQGVIVAMTSDPDPRSFWRIPYGQAPTGPPDCSSSDGITGYGDPGGECAVCEFAQFGTAQDGKGRGQACKVSRFLFLVRPEDRFPLVVKLPIMSIKACRIFLSALTREGISRFGALLSIGLKKEKSGNSEYTHATFKLMQRIDKQTASDLRKLGIILQQVLDQSLGRTSIHTQTIPTDET